MQKDRYQPLINGKAYSWSQIDVNVLGVSVTGITAINYTDDQEMQDNMGAGFRPVSRGYGPITAEASISLHAEEVEAIQDVAPDGVLQFVPEFDIVVSYLPDDGIIRQHTIKNVKFKNNGREVERGDMEIVVEINLQVSHIKWRA